MDTSNFVQKAMDTSNFVQKLELADKHNEQGFTTLQALIEETCSLCHAINTDGRENVEKLQERLKDLELQQKAQNDKQVERSVLHESVTSLQRRIDDLQNGLSKLADVVECQNQLISSQSQELNCCLAEKSRKNDLILDGIRWYEANLGFRVRPTKNNGLWIILTKVVRTDLDREFSFCICHDKESNKYTLLECIPALATSQDLVDELNCTNNFKGFVFNMRNMFQTECCR